MQLVYLSLILILAFCDIKTYPNKTAKNSIMYWRFWQVSNISSLNILKQEEKCWVTSVIVKVFLLRPKLNRKFFSKENFLKSHALFQLIVWECLEIENTFFINPKLASQHCSQRGWNRHYSHNCVNYVNFRTERLEKLVV